MQPGGLRAVECDGGYGNALDDLYYNNGYYRADRDDRRVRVACMKQHRNANTTETQIFIYNTLFQYVFVHTYI